MFASQQTEKTERFERESLSPKSDRGIKIDPGTLSTVAESFARLHRTGWNENDIKISFSEHSNIFKVNGQIGDRVIYSEGITLIDALQKACNNDVIVICKCNEGFDFEARSLDPGDNQ